MDVPFMALTASAPSDVQDDIVSSLHLNDPVFFSCDLDRPNIYMSVNPIKSLYVSMNFDVMYKFFYVYHTHTINHSKIWMVWLSLSNHRCQAIYPGP